MKLVEPRLFLRLGSHAEKDYFEKLGKFADGVIFGANLVESTPGATASLIVKLADEKALGAYFLDPMTYAFGQYFDYETLNVRDDLDWIKSEQKQKDKSFKKDFKKSYRGLAKEYGGVFEQALAANDNKGKAVIPAQLATEEAKVKCATDVVRYQLARLRNEFAKDEEFKKYAAEIPLPEAVFAPYFYIEPHSAGDLLTLNRDLAQAAAALDVQPEVHAIICADASFLADSALTQRLVDELPATGIDGVWLWFSKFYEEKADQSELKMYVSLVKALSEAGLKVFNLHGGFFSLCLSRIGLSGVSHGIGYGEQKDVVPIIGQSTPTVRYYLPDVHVRLGVAEIERCFKALDVKTADDFHKNVCSCTICKGVLNGHLTEFKQFGEMHFSTPNSRRMAQTPGAAKRCRFHFLLNRFKERDRVRTLSLSDLKAQVDSEYARWGHFPTIEESARHLPRWSNLLNELNQESNPAV